MPASSAERVRAFRARQRAALEADPDAPLRDADELLSPAIAETLAALDLKPEDAAAARLAEVLAVTIDRARSQEWAARWLAPELLRVLAALEATPASRPQQEQAPAAPSGLNQFRSVHRKTFPGA
jgi:hypothetical protein